MGNDGTTIAALMSDPRSRDSGTPACQVRELPLPELEPDSALLRVEFSEVCGTDVHLRNGLLSGVPYPIIPGHVSCGVLERVRGSVRDVEGRTFVEGDRVTFLDVHRTCHACWACLVARATTRCPDRKVYGITYGIDDGLTGGWAGHIYLKPGTRVISLDGVPSETYMAGGCSLPTALHAVDRADIAIGDTVLVLGSGPVGLSVIALSTMRGARRVLCIGAPNARLNTAATMGADGVLNFTEVTESERVACAADFVQQHQAVAAGVVQDVGGFRHLDHEGRTPAGQVVAGTDTREYAVDRADDGRLGGHPTTGVSEQDDQCGLTHIG